MEISLLKALLTSISSYLYLSSSDCINSESVPRHYYHKAEEILKLVKPILDAVVDSEIASDETLCKTLKELGQSVDKLRELIENWQPLSSKVYFVLQIESLMCKIQTSSLDVLKQLKAFCECLPDEMSLDSLEKIKLIGCVQPTSIIKDAVTDQEEGKKPSYVVLEKIAENFWLKTNQDILIEAVALEKLKENAEQADNTEEAEYIDQIISLVTHMHECLVFIDQSESCSIVPIPADFCCPLSLALMTDPVIVASGQTYERAYIKNWIDLGLNVCPKTRKTLSHINLIPNYTVKALIANWCETNNVKLVEPKKPTGLSQASWGHGHMDSCAIGELSAFSPSKINQSLGAGHSGIGTPAKNTTSVGLNWEGTSLMHPQSTSEVGLNIARLTLAGSDDRAASSEECALDRDDHVIISPTRKESPNSIVEENSRNHMRTMSESSSLSDASVSQGAPADGNDATPVSSNLRGYNNDASTGVSPEPNNAFPLTTPQREPEFPQRLLEIRSRNQTSWRRPSERFMPRMVSSSATETRSDLSDIENQVWKLVDELKSLSLYTQRAATEQLRLLAKHNMDNRIVIANCGAINLLVNMLHSTDFGIQENAVTALLNLSINDNNKSLIANADAIDPLIHVLETGSPEAKENSAATLFSLSVIEENKIKIGRSGAIRPLVDLLGNGTPRGKKDAATALFNLSIFHENKARIVQAGAVKHLVDLMDPAAGMVDKAVAVLANLATIPEGRTAIGQENGIPLLVEVVELGTARGKENAAASLLHLCQSSGRFCSQVLQEGAVPPLVALSQTGTPRAKEKAQALLNYFRNQKHGNAGRG